MFNLQLDFSKMNLKKNRTKILLATGLIFLVVLLFCYNTIYDKNLNSLDFKNTKNNVHNAIDNSAWAIPKLDLETVLLNKKINMSGPPGSSTNIYTAIQDLTDTAQIKTNSNIEFALKLQKDNAVNKVVSSYNYTIFDNKDVAFRTKEELAELYEATRDDIRILVTLKPERKLLHEVIIKAVTELRWDNPISMQEHVKVHYNILKQAQQFKELIADSNEYRLNLVKRINAEEISSKFKTERIQKDYQPGNYISGFTKQDALVSLYVDESYKQNIYPKIETYVSDFYKNYFKKYPQKKISINPKKQPQTIMLAGGPASGKSTYTRVLKAKLQHNGISWKDIVKINTDDYKELLYLEQNIFSSQLVQPEAQMLSHYRLKELVGNLQKAKKIQYLFWDQVLIDPRRIEWGLLNNGAVNIYIISSDTVKALTRSLKRGHDSGRFEPTEMILDFHKQVASELPGVITKFAGKKLYLTLLDNNGQKYNTKKVFEVYNPNKYAIIFDRHKFQDFITKMRINNKAKSEEELLFKIANTEQVVDIESYLKPLVYSGYTID